MKKKRSIRCKRKFIFPHSIRRKSLASYESKELSFWSVARRNKNEKLYDLSEKLIICVKCNLFVVMERLKKNENWASEFFFCSFHAHFTNIFFSFSSLMHTCSASPWHEHISYPPKRNEIFDDCWKCLLKVPDLKLS